MRASLRPITTLRREIGMLAKALILVDTRRGYTMTRLASARRAPYTRSKTERRSDRIMTTTRPSRLHAYRQRRDEFMRAHEQSPLTEGQRANFCPLEYFAEDPNLSFILEVDKDVPHEPVELPTTTGETKHYVPFG